MSQPRSSRYVPSTPLLTVGPNVMVAPTTGRPVRASVIEPYRLLHAPPLMKKFTSPRLELTRTSPTICSAAMASYRPAGSVREKRPDSSVTLFTGPTRTGTPATGILVTKSVTTPEIVTACGIRGSAGAVGLPPSRHAVRVTTVRMRSRTNQSTEARETAFMGRLSRSYGRESRRLGRGRGERPAESCTR